MIVGIDLSLTSTGLAKIHKDGNIETHTVISTGTRADTIHDRGRRITRLAGEIVDWIGPRFPQHYVIEAPSYGSTGSGGWDRAGLWWHVVAELSERTTDSHVEGSFGFLATIAPMTRAKWATGTGRSDKAAVASALTRLLPEVPIPNSDVADALVLAHIGAVALGYSVPMLPGRHSELPKAIAHWAGAA